VQVGLQRRGRRQRQGRGATKIPLRGEFAKEKGDAVGKKERKTDSENVRKSERRPFFEGTSRVEGQEGGGR